MKPTVWIIAGLTLFTATTNATASRVSTKTPAEIEAGAVERFKKADTNNDGSLSKDEFLARQEKRFNEIDTDHDGKISPKEMKASRDAKRIAHQKRVAEKAKQTLPAAH